MAYLNDSYQGALVDWNAGRLLPAPRLGRPKRREMFFPTRCANPDCRKIRWLTRSAAQKAEEECRICRKCQTSKAGKLGWAATVALYGCDFAIKAIRRYQLSNPSYPEALVDDLLTQLKATYLRQVEFRAEDNCGGRHHFILDFVLQTPKGLIPVEVNGYWHKRRRVERDRWLAELWPGPQVEFLDADAVDTDPEGIRNKLQQLIQPE